MRRTFLFYTTRILSCPSFVQTCEQLCLAHGSNFIFSQSSRLYLQVLNMGHFSSLDWTPFQLGILQTHWHGSGLISWSFLLDGGTLSVLRSQVEYLVHGLSTMSFSFGALSIHYNHFKFSIQFCYRPDDCFFVVLLLTMFYTAYADPFFTPAAGQVFFQDWLFLFFICCLVLEL